MESLIYQHKYRIYIMAFIMSFNGGYINSICLASLLNNPIGFVTGNMTLIGVNLANAAYWEVADLVGLMLAFFVGCIMSGLIIKDRNFERGRCYSISLSVQFILVVIAMLLLYYHYSQAGFLLAAGLGMQNSMTTHYGSALVRTTHMTGTATDLGIIIGRWIKRDNIEFLKMKLYLILIVGFIVGVIIAALIFTQIQALSLLLSLVIYLLMLTFR